MILFVRDLTVIDFSYLCAKRGMLGESYIVDVELHGGLDQSSMVLDFALVKKVIKQAIDQLVDHKLAYPARHSALQTSVIDATEKLVFQTERGQIQIASPLQAHVAIDAEVVDQNTVQAFLLQQLTPLLPSNVQQLVLTLRPEATRSFYYHYSHGLKKHDGNCQRIAHGHRSTIEIYTKGMLNPRLNKAWCERWEDIYLGSREDLVEPSNLAFLSAQADSYAFRYQAPQGWFELVMPTTHVELVPCDTTVECLAQYIAEQLHQQEPNQYKVVAYEGVGKGAVGFAG